MADVIPIKQVALIPPRMPDPEANAAFLLSDASSAGVFIAMPPSPSFITSKEIRPVDRLASIRGHMEGSNPTVFTSDHVPQAPEDPLFGLMAAYRKDTFDKKVDLGIGAYRDNNAKPWVLPVVKQVSFTTESIVRSMKAYIFLQADERLRQDPDLNHEYLPIAGLAEFTSAAQKLMLGADSPAVKEQRVLSTIASIKLH